MLIKKQRIPVKQIILLGLLPSALKKIYYRIKGYKIGRNISIGFGSVIIGKNVSIGDNTKIGFMTVIRAKEIHMKKFIRIGSLVFIDTEKVFIDDDARINENVIIGGIKFPDSYFSMGKRTIIMEYSYINPTKPIRLGDDTGIGGHCLLFTHGSWLPQIDGYPVTFAPITLGKRVWLPWRVFIMPGVEIGDNVVIGANSLVSKSIPSNCFAAGSPAKIIREDYPCKLSEEKREKVIKSIFNDFVDYLNYNSFAAKIIQNNDSLIINIKLKKSTLVLKYINFSSDLEGMNLSGIDILLIDNEKFDISQFKETAKMIINFQKKERIGTSALGEEFVNYVSRYGIRFSRLD